MIRWKRLLVPLVLIAAMGVAQVVMAKKQGEALWPTVLALALAFGLLAGVFVYAARPIEGLPPADAVRERVRRIQRLVAVVGVALTVVAVVAVILHRAGVF